MKYLTCVVTMIFLVVYGFSMTAFATADGGTGFTLTTSSANVAPEATFTVTATGSVTAMYAFESKFSYDTTKLEFISATTSLAGGFSVPPAPVAGSNELVFAYTKLGNAAVENGLKDLTQLTFAVKKGTSGTATVTWNRFMNVEKSMSSTPLTLDHTASITIVSGTPTTPTDPTTPTNPTGSGTTPTTPTGGSIQVTPSVTGDVAKSVVTQEAITNALSQMKPDSSGVRTAIVEIKEMQGANRYLQELPSSLFQNGDGSQKLEIQTSLGTVTLPDNMLSKINLGNASQVGVSIGQGDKSQLKDSVKQKIANKPLLELTILLDGKQVDWKNNKAPVTIAIPYTPTAEELKHPEHIAIWYIDGEGNVNKVPSGKYNAATGEVTFTTTHFSKYAVGYEVKSFSDLTQTEWAKEAIEVLTSKGIVNGTSDTTFNPNSNISRAEFLQLLIGAIGLSADVDMNFEDVRKTDYYYEAAGIALKLNVSNGVGNNRLNPSEAISRQDMMVMVERAMKLGGKNLSSYGTTDLSAYKDASQIADYAKASLLTLIQSGLVQGANNLLHPTGGATRAEAAVLMYRVYKHS